jgi:FkbM family methyltransferase
MKLSYAQNLEDYHLDLVFPQATGTYVDVGGGHPVADNVSFWFYLKGWQGLVVEPQESLAAAYAGIRPRDRVYCGLAGRIDGQAEFHEVAGLHGLSSMVGANAARARELAASVRTLPKPVARLSRLIDEAKLAAIDFLKIDVEGAEADVLAGLDLRRHRPRVIVVEAINPDNPHADVSAWEPPLLGAGYQSAFFDGLNRFYVAVEQSHLRDQFPAQPADWQTVAHLWDCGRVADAPDHPDRRLAEVLAAGLYAELPALPVDVLARVVRRGLEALGERDTAKAAAALLGTAEYPGEYPGPRAPATSDLDPLIADDRFRAALGRIACMYDGGHITD